MPPIWLMGECMNKVLTQRASADGTISICGENQSPVQPVVCTQPSKTRTQSGGCPTYGALSPACMLPTCLIPQHLSQDPVPLVAWSALCCWYGTSLSVETEVTSNETFSDYTRLLHIQRVNIAEAQNVSQDCPITSWSDFVRRLKRNSHRGF